MDDAVVFMPAEDLAARDARMVARGRWLAAEALGLLEGAEVWRIAVGNGTVGDPGPISGAAGSPGNPQPAQPPSGLILECVDRWCPVHAHLTSTADCVAVVPMWDCHDDADRLIPVIVTIRTQRPGDVIGTGQGVRERVARHLYRLMGPRGEDTAAAWADQFPGMREAYLGQADRIIAIVREGGN